MQGYKPTPPRRQRRVPALMALLSGRSPRTNGGVAGGRGRARARPSLKVNQRLQSLLQPPNNNKNQDPNPENRFEAATMMRKDVNKPKGKTSAYAFFVQTCREEHRKKNPEQSALSPVIKCFEDMAKADKVRYNREMRDYVPPKGFGKRGRKRKDPTHPKDPLTVQREAAVPRLSIGDCAKKLGEMWSKLSQSEKQPYEEKAQKLREKYDRDMVAYRGGGTYARNPALQLREERKRRTTMGRMTRRRRTTT
ncbi:hypothetical protein INR49_008940 [Caranx melampygus]|nr:hypothetical protein INR49_008940 [Caranx melampygus]